MKTLRVDDDGDLQLDGQHSLRMVGGVDEKAQSVRILLGTNLDEWFLNKAHGLDYSIIQVKNPNMEDIRAALQEALQQEPRLEEIENIELDFDERERKLKVNLRLRMDGEILEEEAEVG